MSKLGEDTITITRKEYESLQRDSNLILAMDVLKVWKHWDGYDDAVEIAEDYSIK